MTKGKKRHDFSYQLTKLLTRSYLSRRFNYDYETVEVDYSPYIVVSNHLTNWDPVLIAMSFKKSMYYVATDHVLRMGLKGKLLEFSFSPIARAKSTQDTHTVITIFRRLGEKSNVCIFVEGNTSFDGETGTVQPSIGKLVKKAGVALVTYRFSGSYFTFPRWARFSRRGKMTGRLGQIYSPEKIAAMSEDEIFRAIRDDIYVNAYEEQKKDPVAFLGKSQAEYLETVLYCCPGCGQFSTLTSRGDRLSCVCGLELRYNEFGCFEYPRLANGQSRGENEKPPFTTILDWAKWQRNEIKTFAEKALAFDGSVAIFTDSDQKLFQVTRASHNTLLAKGTLCLYNNRLAIVTSDSVTVEFPLEIIQDLSIITMMTIIFSTKENKIFEIHSKRPRSALKYLEMFKALKSIKTR